MNRAHVLVLFLVSITLFGFQQDEKVKVRFKDGQVLVNKVVWAKYTRVNDDFAFQTLAGIDFMRFKSLFYGTGKFDANGHELKHWYGEVIFSNEEIPPFEVDLTEYDVFKYFYQNDVISSDALNLDKAKEFKKRFEDNVSDRRFKTK